MNNPYFSKSLRLLAHPLSLAAIGLMLANDTVFKTLWPSWWTGKLSDFAGMFFLPFLAAALLSAFVPGRWVGGLAFGITGVGYTLLKTNPGINALLGGLGLQARLDPSDLLALLALLPAAWLWRSAKDTPVGPILRLNWRLLALPLAALVSLADAAAPDMGVACLQAGSDGVVATALYYQQSYLSSDGGLTWQVLEEQNPQQCQPQQDIPVLKSAAGDAQYRINRGQSVERSVDGGSTWSTEFSSSAMNEQEEVYMRMTRSGNLSFNQGPYAAVIDPVSGNLVLAMGLDGALVRDASGKYTWAAVGPYQHDSLKQAGVTGVILLIQNQIWLALLAALGWLFTRAARLLNKARVWVILGWVGLGFTSFLAAPQVASDGYLGIASIIALFFMTAATLVALLVAAIRLKGTVLGLFGRALPQMVALGLACLLPYVLWGVGVLPGYGWAIVGSAGLVVVLLVVFSVGKRREGEPVRADLSGRQE